MNNFYVYIWYTIENNHVFYVGKGHGDRCKEKSKRNETFNYYINNFNCTYIIKESNLSEQEAFDREIYYINYYKGIGMADANYHKGGKSGGNVLEYMPESVKQKFINKMSIINKERCSTEEFKQESKERMINRYADPKERELQRQRSIKAWKSEGLREEQRKRTIEYYKNHPEFAEQKAQKLCKKCAMELNGQKIIFNSKKELFKYLNDNYNFNLYRQLEQKMFNKGMVYYTNDPKKSYMNGLRVYYI